MIDGGAYSLPRTATNQHAPSSTFPALSITFSLSSAMRNTRWSVKSSSRYGVLLNLDILHWVKNTIHLTSAVTLIPPAHDQFSVKMPSSVHSQDQDQSMVDAEAQQQNGSATEEYLETAEGRITIVCRIQLALSARDWSLDQSINSWLHWNDIAVLFCLRDQKLTYFLNSCPEQPRQLLPSSLMRRATPWVMRCDMWLWRSE